MITHYLKQSLQNRRVKGGYNDIHRGVVEAANSGIFKIGAVAAAVTIAGLAALSQTNLHRKFITADPLAVEQHLPKDTYNIVPYIVQAGEDIKKLSEGNPLIERYLIEANRITKVKPGDIIGFPVPSTSPNGKTLQELIDEIPRSAP